MNEIDKRIITSISLTKKNTKFQKLNKDINYWSIKNKKDIDRLFKYLLKSLDDNNLDINVELKVLYRDFVELSYMNSNINV